MSYGLLGITCRFDVIELLEKRVKSRFSHRQIFLFPGPENDNNPTSYLAHALNHIEYYLNIPNNAKVKISTKVKKQWNMELETLLRDRKFEKIIQRVLSIDNTEVALKNLLVCKLKVFCKHAIISEFYRLALFLA